MKFAASGKNPIEMTTPCLIIGVTDARRQSGTAAAVNKASGGRLSKLIASGDISTRPGKVFLWTDVSGVKAERVLVVGCGAVDKFNASALTKAAVTAIQYLADRNVKSAATALHELKVADRDLAWRARQVALASEWGAYRYTATKKSAKRRSSLGRLTLLGAANFSASIKQATAIAAGVNRARELGNLPPNICTPAYLASECRGIAERFDKAKIQVLGRKQLEQLGMGALLGVAAGSANPPKFIVLRYTGAGAKDAPYVLIGKGITFDTGGISLKPGKGMDEMKYDMGGAAGVIGTFEACAMLGLPINLVVLVPAVENMPDGKAYRPGDVLTSMSGKTVEVLNTDAEGRLILCDALTYAARFKPRAMIDTATLTGACVVALGKHASGLMSPDEQLAGQLLAAGESTHDRAWRLPLWDDYQSDLDTPYADMANVGGRFAGAITAGCFLQRFADAAPWAHLDIAGSAWDGGTRNGATGRPVPLLTQYLIDRAG